MFSVLEADMREEIISLAEENQKLKTEIKHKNKLWKIAFKAYKNLKNKVETTLFPVEYIDFICATGIQSYPDEDRVVYDFSMPWHKVKKYLKKNMEIKNMDKAIIRERIYNYRHSFHHWIIGVFKEYSHVLFSVDDFECYTDVKRSRHKLNQYYKKTGISYAITTEDGRLYTASSALKYLIRFSKSMSFYKITEYINWLEDIEKDMNTTKDLEPENCKLKIMLNAVKEANQDLQKEIKRLRRKLKWIKKSTKGNTSKKTKND